MVRTLFATLFVLLLATSAVAQTSNNITVVEDTPSVSGEQLVMIGVRRCNTTPSSSSGVNGDRSSICADANGRLYVNSTLYNEAGTALTEDTQLTNGVAVTRGSTTGGAMLCVGDADGNVTDTPADGAVLVSCDLDGNQWVKVLSSALPSGASTAANQTTANTALSQIETAVETMAAAGAGGGTSNADGGAFTVDTTHVTTAGGLYEAAPTSCTTGDSCAAGLTAKRALKTTAYTEAGVEIPTMAVNAGAASSTTARVVAASDSPDVVALQALDNDPCTTGTKLFVPISQATSTELFAGTASNRTYICGFMVTQAADSTQTFSLVSGTGTVCDTSTGAMIGATTAANGMSLPFAIGGANATIAKSDTDAENVCLLQSTTDRLSGVISYVVAAN